MNDRWTGKKIIASSNSISNASWLSVATIIAVTVAQITLKTHAFSLTSQVIHRKFVLPSTLDYSLRSRTYLTVTSSTPLSSKVLLSSSSSNDDENNDEVSLLSTIGEEIEDPLLAMSIRTAVSKMQRVMDPDFFPSSYGSLKQLHKNCIQAVEVAPSSIPGAGMGAFAQKNIKRGTVICFYPVDGVGVDYGDGETSYVTTAAAAASVNNEDNNNQDDDKDSSSPNYFHYLIGSRPLLGNAIDAPLFIDVCPNRPTVPGCSFMSHFINDGAIVESNSEGGVLDYYKLSRVAKNCVHIPFGPSPIMATVTTRKIKKGEELFTSYGCSYWLEALMSGESTTEITEEIQAQVKETAKDLFAGMKRVQDTYGTQADSLQLAFEEV
mmetsp:Transcript_50321/g.58733  ORF Transcript_50321/g.58733 Transcript_50321/m.58733 type:complete len:380 (+) Transcript_50321:35-1174(+)